LTSATAQLPNIDELLEKIGADVRDPVGKAFDRFNTIIAQREKLIEQREKRIAQLELELKIREEQLRHARLLRYGPKGEKLSHEQVLLLDLEPGVQAGEVEKEAELADADKNLEEANTKTKKTKKEGHRYVKAHPGRTPLPAHLPREEVIIACTEAPAGELIGYEVKEELVIQPAEFKVQVIKREKRKVTVAGRSTILTAPAPARIVEKGQLGNSVVVELLVNKYCDHLPIFRQRRIWKRDYGIDLPDSALLRPLFKAADLLTPLARAIGVALKAGGFIQADETRVAVLQQEGKGRNDTAWFWQYSKPGGLVYFDYQDSRSRAGPSDFLADFSGRLQSDGYEVYTELGRRLHSHAGCWAHVRRKFDEARKVAPKEVPCKSSQEVLELIGKLYLVEKEAREQGLDAAGRLALRQQRKVSEQLKGIKQRVMEIRQRVLPASLLSKACDYMLNQWEKLVVYAQDGQIEIDNNWCENAMRDIALGRKNWMHLGSQESGPKVAAIMSVIASAQRAGHNVRRYLTAVLEKLADPEFKITQIETLLPGNWKEA
jgi:transposase